MNKSIDIFKDMRIYRDSFPLPEGKKGYHLISDIHFGFDPQVRRIRKHGIYSVVDTMIGNAYERIKRLDREHRFCIKFPFPMKNSRYKFEGFDRKI